MRSYLYSTLITLLSLLPLRAETNHFSSNQSVICRHEPEETFRRIREYFTGVEQYKDKIIFRSDANARAGYYWIIRPGTPLEALPNGSKIELSYQPPESRNIVTREHLIENSKAAKAIYVGETGKHAPPSDSHPTAWKIRIISPLGVELFTKQSYLWSFPVKK